jgi:hypothetical protein
MARSGASSVLAGGAAADEDSGCAAVVEFSTARWTVVDADGPVAVAARRAVDAPLAEVNGVTALEALPAPSERAGEWPVAPLPGTADRRGRATAALVLRWTAVPAGVLDDGVETIAVLRCTVAAPGVLRRTVAPPVLGAEDVGGEAAPGVVAVLASSPGVAIGDCLTILPGAATGSPGVSGSARRCTPVPGDAARGASGAA